MERVAAPFEAGGIGPCRLDKRKCPSERRDSVQAEMKMVARQAVARGQAVSENS